MSSVEEVIRKHGKICWYPSAGADFRVILYLSEQYCKWKEVKIPPDKLPDLFILSDADPKDINFTGRKGISRIEVLSMDNPHKIKEFKVFRDNNTEIIASNVEVLDRLEIPYDKQLFVLGKSKNFGWPFLFDVHIRSKQLGEWDTKVLYLLTENTGFALRYLLPKGLPIDYIVRVRYGDSFGGSRVSGEWLLNLIPYLKVKYFLSNEVTNSLPKDTLELLKEKYLDLENIWENTERVDIEEFYRVNGAAWSDQGDIHWYSIK